MHTNNSMKTSSSMCIEINSYVAYISPFMRTNAAAAAE